MQNIHGICDVPYIQNKIQEEELFCSTAHVCELTYHGKNLLIYIYHLTFGFFN